MTKPTRKTPVVFYRSAAGAEVLRDWLRELAPADRNVIGQDLMRAQFRWPVGMPLCRPLGGGLWELRSDLTGHRIARVLFCFSEGRLLLLHGFIKKPKKRRMPNSLWRASECASSSESRCHDDEENPQHQGSFDSR